MTDSDISTLQKLVQEAQARVAECEEKDRKYLDGIIGFPRHRKDPCESVKEELAELERELAELDDQLQRGEASAASGGATSKHPAAPDAIDSDPIGNAILGGLAAGLTSGGAALFDLLGEGAEAGVTAAGGSVVASDTAAATGETAVGDAGAGGVEPTQGEGGVEQPSSPGGEEPKPHVPEHIETDDPFEHPGADPEDLPPDEGGNNPNKKPTWER